MKFLKIVGVIGMALLASSCLFGGPYTVGGTVTGLEGSGLVLQNSSGKYLSVTASGSFTFPSGLDNGASYSVTVRTQPSNPSQTCTVTNATGTIEKADVTDVLVNCTQAARYAYVANQTANTISAYQIDSTSGALVSIVGSPFSSSGLAPVALAVDPNGTYLYVVDNASNAVSVYAIDTTLDTTTSGSLTPAGEIVSTGNSPLALTIDPTGSYLYVANVNDDTVSAYAISSGSLTPIAGSPFAVGREPSALKTDPSGTHLYVTNFTDGSVSAYTIDPATGALSDVSGSPYVAGAGTLGIAIEPTGLFAYAVNETAASISGYSITASTGQLTPVAGSPLATGSSPEAIAVDPSGKYVYAANVTSNNSIASYAIAAGSGALTLISSVGAGTLPVSLAVDPSGGFVYVANSQSDNVSVYAVDAATGALTAVAGSPFVAGAGARAIVVE